MMRRLLTIALLLVATYCTRSWLDRDSVAVFSAPDLEHLPLRIGNWQTVRQGGLSQETLKILHADGVLLRDYKIAPGCRVQLFIAYYRTQHAGESMHSPRNCLPGSGWEPMSSSAVLVDMGNGRKHKINRYLVEKDGKRMLVMYWYQEHDRIVADEYSGKMYLMWDSIHHSQRDGALVRFSAPVRDGLSESQTAEQITQFIRLASPDITSTLFPAMVRH